MGLVCLLLPPLDRFLVRQINYERSSRLRKEDGISQGVSFCSMQPRGVHGRTCLFGMFTKGCFGQDISVIGCYPISAGQDVNPNVFLVAYQRDV